MHLSTAEIINLFFRYKYIILFPIAFLEGPAVAVIAGFMVAIKFMSFLPVYLILVSANIAGDIVYYLLGRLVPREKLNKILSFVGIKEKYIDKAEVVFLKNRKMAIVFGKIAHAIGSVFLITAGIVRVPFNEYISLGTLIEFPKALFFVFAGYYFGHSLLNIGRVVDYSIIGFGIFTALIILAYYFLGRYTDKEILKLFKTKK